MAVGVAWAVPALAVERAAWRAVGDGLVVELDDGTALRLAELAPDVPAATLEALLAPSELIYELVGEVDRTGRLPARVWQAADGSLQERLVDAGLARVWPTHDGEFAAALFLLEDQARAAGRGGWGDGRFRILPASPPPDVEGFAVLRGRVVSTGRTDRFLYLNFGRSYRSSTSVRLRPRDGRSWRLTDRLEDLVGREVEVRGVVFPDGGPMIELDHPAQLRVVD